MKILVTGVRHQHGKAKKTGNDYSMKQLQVLSPLETVSNDTITINGRGLVSGVIDMSDGGFEMFMKTDLRYPLELDVTTDTEFRQGRAVTVVTGFVKS